MATSGGTIKRKSKSRPTKPKGPARKLTNAKLLKLAQKHRPPQSWFEQNDLPFIPKPA